MRDFTIRIYKDLLVSLSEAGYKFQTFSDYLDSAYSPVVILRHDVDALAENSLVTAKLENSLGIRGTYYFRIVAGSNDPEIIREIVKLNHEIGYHYEDMSICGGNILKAIKSFESNLKYFRQFAQVKTICMHGSPLSSFDNRKIWDDISYREFGITGEPYFDTDFNKVLYLTDTGRRWDGEKYSVRDKVPEDIQNDCKKLFHSTSEIILAAAENSLPDQVMITVHPQRWTNNIFLWSKEYIFQNLKNIIKRIIVR